MDVSQANHQVSMPLQRLRKYLLDSGILLPDGKVKETFAKAIRQPHIDNQALKNLLSNKIPIPLLDFVKKYLKENPENDIHLIGSSVPLTSSWFKKTLNQKNITEECKRLIRPCLDQKAARFSDIDLRIMIRSPAKSYQEHLIPMQPKYKINDSMSVATYKGNPYPVDMITCGQKRPPFLTTTDCAYISLREWIQIGKVIPRLPDNVYFGEWLLHKMAKIFYVAEPLNHGAFKRLVQFQTYGYCTPQKRIINKIVLVFLQKKSLPLQFTDYFSGRINHLVPSPKTQLAFCLNLISIIGEIFPIEKQFDYHRECRHLLGDPVKGLLSHIYKYIKDYSYRCEYLLTTLKMCSFMILEGKQAFSIKDALPVITCLQNGEPYLSLSLGRKQNAVVQMKYDPENSIEKLLEIFRPDFISEDTQPRMEHLENILIKFMIYILSKGKKGTGYLFPDVYKKFESVLPGDRPILHLLNLFWKILGGRDLYCESIICALPLLQTRKLQKHFLKPLSRKISDTESIYEVIITHYTEQSVEQGYKVWTLAASSPQFDETLKCRLLATLFEKSLLKSLDKVNPVILANFCSIKIRQQIMHRVEINQAWEIAASFFPQLSSDQLAVQLDKLINHSEKTTASLNRRRIAEILPNPNTSILDAYTISKSFIRLAKIGLVVDDRKPWLKAIGQLARQTETAWQLLNLQNPLSEEDKLKCMTKIGKHCTNTSILRSVIDRLISLAPNSPHELIEKEINLLISGSKFDQILARLKELSSADDFEEKLTGWILRLSDLYLDNGLDSSREVLSVWREFERNFSESNPVWLKIYRVMLRVNIKDCWYLMTKRDSLRINMHGNASQEIIRAKRWNQFLALSLNQDHSLKHDIRGLFFDLICRDVVDIKGKLDDQQIIIKTYKWPIIPESYLTKNSFTDSERTFYKIRGYIIEKIISGLWSLRKSEKKRLQSRLDLVGSVLWLRSKCIRNLFPEMDSIRGKPFKETYKSTLAVYNQTICDLLGKKVKKPLSIHFAEWFLSFDERRQTLILHTITGIISTLLVVAIVYITNYMCPEKPE